MCVWYNMYIYYKVRRELHGGWWAKAGKKNICESESACISNSPGLWNVKKGKNASGQLTMPRQNTIKTETHQPDGREKDERCGRVDQRGVSGGGKDVEGFSMFYFFFFFARLEKIFPGTDTLCCNNIDVAN